MRKDADDCFLCERRGKGKRFRFYSGVMKGGTTHRLLTRTVHILEHWSDLTIHEIQVCRECQLRLWEEWRQKQLIPMLLYGIGAAVTALLALAMVVLLLVMAQFAAPAAVLVLMLGLGVLSVAMLALAGLFTYHLLRYLAKKPRQQAQLEPLIIKAAMDKLPNSDHTYMTNEQYVERYEKGIIG